MATRIFGCSDDLIELKGDVDGEVNHFRTDEEEKGTLLILSDGTLLEAKFGKAGIGIWAINLIKKGPLFVKIDHCNDEEADPHSDIAIFKDGLKWAYAAKEWERVK